MQNIPYRIALFANHTPGLEIASFLSRHASNDQVCALYLTGENAALQEKISNALKISCDKVFIGPDIVKSKSHLDWLKQQNIDAIICIYWPWLLQEEVFSLAKLTLNFHPALLPINRGWYPHVHSLIDGSKAGVTLHQIEKGADTGDIWIQKEVSIQPTDTAKTLYDRLQIEIVNLFKDSWSNIKSGVLVPTVQNNGSAIYHSKNEIESLDYIDINKTYTGRDLINKLRARSFGNRGFAYYIENGEKIFVKIELSTDSSFK